MDGSEGIVEVDAEAMRRREMSWETRCCDAEVLLLLLALCPGSRWWPLVDGRVEVANGWDGKMWQDGLGLAAAFSTRLSHRRAWR